MRTTIDLPDELVKQAKIAAINRGTTLKDLISGALVRELGAEYGVPKEVKFPLIRSDRPGSVNLTNEDIARMEEEDDVEYLRRSFG